MMDKYNFKLTSGGGGNLSQTITLLRFPLAVFILLLHSSFEHELRNGVSIFEGWEAPVYHHIDFLFVQNICNIAVPLFFLISGFLLFLKENAFTFDIYKNKLRKRFRSLFIPYIIWNVLILLLYVIVQNIAPSMNSGRNKLIADYSIQDYFMSFWSMSYINEGGVSGPIDSPLWFIRDLMVMIVISPVIYWGVRKMKMVLPILLVLAYVVGINTGIQGFSMTALAFFPIGAYFGIMKLDFVGISRKFFKYTALMYSILLVGIVVAIGPNCEQTIVNRLAVLVGVFMVIGMASCLEEKYSCKISAFLTGSTFFIFASHSEVLKIVIRLTSRIGIDTDWFYSIAYFICPMITLIILLAVYWVLVKTMPKVVSVLSGGR